MLGWTRSLAGAQPETVVCCLAAFHSGRENLAQRVPPSPSPPILRGRRGCGGKPGPAPRWSGGEWQGGPCTELLSRGVTGRHFCRAVGEEEAAKISVPDGPPLPAANNRWGPALPGRGALSPARPCPAARSGGAGPSQAVTCTEAGRERELSRGLFILKCDLHRGVSISFSGLTGCQFLSDIEEA